MRFILLDNSARNVKPARVQNCNYLGACFFSGSCGFLPPLSILNVIVSRVFSSDMVLANNAFQRFASGPTFMILFLFTSQLETDGVKQPMRKRQQEIESYIKDPNTFSH